jgi:hypothetical protein
VVDNSIIDERRRRGKGRGGRGRIDSPESLEQRIYHGVMETRKKQERFEFGLGIQETRKKYEM